MIDIINNVLDNLFQSHTFNLYVDNQLVFYIDYGTLFIYLFIFIVGIYISTFGLYLFKMIFGVKR